MNTVNVPCLATGVVKTQKIWDNLTELNRVFNTEAVRYEWENPTAIADKLAVITASITAKTAIDWAPLVGERFNLVGSGGNASIVH